MCSHCGCPFTPASYHGKTKRVRFMCHASSHWTVMWKQALELRIANCVKPNCVKVIGDGADDGPGAEVLV